MQQDEFDEILLQLLSAAAADPSLAAVLCDSVLSNKILSTRMRAAIRKGGEGKRPGKQRDDMDKLASFVAYTNLSIPENGPRLKKGLVIGQGAVAKLLAEDQNISLEAFNNKITEAKKLWKKLAEHPTPENIATLLRAGRDSDELMLRYIALLDKNTDSSN